MTPSWQGNFSLVRLKAVTDTQFEERGMAALRLAAGGKLEPLGVRYPPEMTRRQALGRKFTTQACRWMARHRVSWKLRDKPYRANAPLTGDMPFGGRRQ